MILPQFRPSLRLWKLRTLIMMGMKMAVKRIDFAHPHSMTLMRPHPPQTGKQMTVMTMTTPRHLGNLLGFLAIQVAGEVVLPPGSPLTHTAHHQMMMPWVISMSHSISIPGKIVIHGTLTAIHLQSLFRKRTPRIKTLTVRLYFIVTQKFDTVLSGAVCGYEPLLKNRI